MIPFTTYRLRLIAVNVVGPSEPSDATKEFQTIQAPPAHPPWNVTVRAMSAKELRVRWIVSFGQNFIHVYHLKIKHNCTHLIVTASSTNRVVWECSGL